MVAVRKPAPPEIPSRMTVAEFLEWAGSVEDGTRYQLIDGAPRAMAPASMTHGIVQSTAARLIGNHLAALRNGCRVITTPGVRPRVRAENNFRIPDLGVSCAPDQPGLRAVPDPVLLIEILSPSNEADTLFEFQGQNVWAYTSLPTVREILVLRVTEIAAELLRRGNDGHWPEQPLRVGATEELVLESIGFRVALSDLYEGTHLARSSAGQ
ncbi:Uma2 family endonuclease [Azospirillum sp. SYSU D00513]|uniref:Uma2 family endonuclease n=1 Tax=Azospirillum sp. SYSU D00513 TaxID=2812561 RepID=UPI001A9710C8|nr:Uma2 family endonuclease [Azospirillum sp. SYSU D00513]